MKKRLSPFSKDFWIYKGYNEKDAIYKANSIRPIRKEYWIEKGYSESDAIVLAQNKKSENNKLGAKKAAARSQKEFRESSIRCIEFWLKKGFNEKYKELKIEYDISIDKKYPESSFRYDFKIKDEYIEICPMIHENHDYKLKMLKKKQIFNCILLSSIKEIDAYLEKLSENFR